jgi:hypothetical protein
VGRGACLSDLNSHGTTTTSTLTAAHHILRRSKSVLLVLWRMALSAVVVTLQPPLSCWRVAAMNSPAFPLPTASPLHGRGGGCQLRTSASICGGRVEDNEARYRLLMGAIVPAPSRKVQRQRLLRDAGLAGITWLVAGCGTADLAGRCPWRFLP